LASSVLSDLWESKERKGAGVAQTRVSQKLKITCRSVQAPCLTKPKSLMRGPPSSSLLISNSRAARHL
jgi:hypothetical protein